LGRRPRVAVVPARNRCQTTWFPPPRLAAIFHRHAAENRSLEHVKKSERRPRRPEFLTVRCGGYGAMPSGLVFRGNPGTDGTFPRKGGAKMSRQSPHCGVG